MVRNLISIYLSLNEIIVKYRAFLGLVIAKALFFFPEPEMLLVSFCDLAYIIRMLALLLGCLLHE